MHNSTLIDATDYIVYARVERQFDQADLVWRGQRLTFTVFFRAIRADRVDAARFNIFRQTSISTGASIHLRKQIQ